MLYFPTLLSVSIILIITLVALSIWQPKLAYLPKPHPFSSMTLQSGIFTFNRKLIIGFVSSIITAAIGYGIRLILLRYLNYDIFTNLDNWSVSLSYFCSLGGIRFVITEFLKDNTLMYYSGCTTPISNPTSGSAYLPVSTNPVGYNCPMQAPNEPGTGNFRPENSSSSAGYLTTDDRLKLEQRIHKVGQKVVYFEEQLEGARQDLDIIVSNRSMYIENGKQDEWQRAYMDSTSALKDCQTNLSSEMRMQTKLKEKLASGDYSMSGPSAISKRRLSDCSIDKDNSNKRTSNNP
jgi:hypothetical protein